MGMTFAGAVHLTHDDGAGGLVRVCGAREVRVARDLLTVGPCDADPVRHRALRLAHWGPAAEDPAGGVDLDVDVPAPLPMVLWATTAWSDQLWLWWTLDLLARTGVDPQRLWLAQPRPAHPLASVGATSHDEARRALAAAVPISAELIREGAALWRRYAAPSPLLFDQARRAGSSTFPHLRATAEVHGEWFPRRIDGTLRLAALDELLLSIVGITLES